MTACDVLVLGGTTEARAIAARLSARGLDVVTSLAGRTSAPLAVEGAVRTGGFGGAEGLGGWLSASRPRAVVDATHPFATRISAAAVAACATAGVPLVRVLRPGWVASPEDRWERVPSLEAAAARVDAVGRRAFLAVGSGGVAAFAGVSAWCLVRSIEPPDGPLPASCEVVLARGPFTVGDEVALLRRWAIDVVVCRDSGGPVDGKLTAARTLGLPVLMVDRPAVPAGVTVVSSVDAAVERVTRPR